MMDEIWKDIPGYEGRYMVSDQGRVRSLITNRVLRQAVFWTGYVYVGLVSASGKKRNCTVHLLVLQAFAGACLPDQESRHLNGIRADNRLSNLCYGTKAENQADRVLHDKGSAGEGNANSKLSAADVENIRELFRTQTYKRGMYTAVARQYGVSSRMISYITTNKHWLN